MAIIKTVNFGDFVREFERLERQNNFSYYGLRALFDYLEELSEDTDSGYELDVICLCCEYSEDTWQEIAANYNIDIDYDQSEDDKINAVREYLENKTTVIDENDGIFVYATF